MFLPIRKRLGEILREDNLLTEAQLQDALEKQKETNERLGKILVNMGFVDEETVLKVLEAKLGIPVINISRRNLDPEVVKAIPEHIAQKYKVIPVEKEGDKLILAMADPLNVLAVDDVRITTGCDVELAIASENEIDNAIASYYGKDTIIKMVEGLPEDLGLDFNEGGLEQLREIVEDAPMVKLVNSLITQAVGSRASDVHVEPREKDLLVRYRIDGVMSEVTRFPKRMQAPIISRLKIMADLDIAERRVPQDGRIQMKIDNKDIDFRVSTLPTIFGEKVVLRILDKSRGLMHLQELGMLPEILKKFRTVITHPYGIILVTGPTGSGKTTTLYSVLSDINTPEKNIITLEDPVEYTLDGINQVQLNIKAGLTFAGGLRSVLRQDPDIIMVGEIRDAETAKIAIQSAMTGHLVLSTLHTNTASATLARLMEMGIEPFLVASSVVGIVAQRLVRRLCPECKEPYEPSEMVAQKLGIRAKPGEQLILFQPKGCPVCSNTGFRGRLALQEVLFMSSGVKDLVTNKASADQIETVAVEEGMMTLRQDGLRKVVLGLTSLEEVMRAVFVADEDTE
ncbi:type II secretion system ATPase GspE [Phosphitispora sp. TUW77]|uniref:type II secretion system ATPase GspE n=1 Tax=Phosphitispora sp. TUW77 TaxID=3152361 RepID=UPI003AB18005